MLIVPTIGWKVASGGGGGGYSLNMTAGDYAGVIFGYLPEIGIGSIDAEPIVGQTLGGLISDPGGALGPPASSCAFQGDITALLSGLDIWVDGINSLGSGWSYNVENGSTGYPFGDGTEFAAGNTYLIEIK